MDYVKKLKKMNTGLKIFLLGAFGLFFLKYVISLTPYMQQKEAYLIQEYQKIQYQSDATVESYELGRGITKRWISSTSSHSDDIKAILLYYQNQLKELGWQEVKSEEYKRYEYVKGRLQVGLFLIKVDKINKISEWNITMRYTDNFI